jgi:DNA-binding CsgD family transcriptional regulator
MKKVSRPFNLVSRSYTIYLGIIDVIDEDNVLFGVDRGFYHFNANCSMMPAKDYHSYIIDLNAFSPPRKTAHKGTGASHPVYAHAKNSFEFSFSSNIIESQEKVQYRFMLEGFDEEWSEWSDRNSKEYNNLYEGTYTLRVIARDESGIESDESEFTFQIMPPPYRSVYAFFFYLALMVLLIFLGIRYRDRKVEQERMKIESEKRQELEEKRKTYEGEQLKSKQKITELLNDRLQQDLKHKSKELSNSMINILHKNEILQNLKQEMQELYLEKNLNKRDLKIKKLINVIDREISTKRDLEVFDTNFNAVHEAFIKNLKELYPSLNQNDHRLCTFIKMNKSTKEIATFLNLSIRGVETSRYRLRKKMNLDSDENLYDIISSI